MNNTGPMQSSLGETGFTKDSGMYRGMSFANIPSEPFSVKQKIDKLNNGYKFTQIVGARTQSAGVLAAQWAGPFGGIARPITEQIFAFPPIWTELELTINYDGSCEGNILRHSIFPSVSFYYDFNNTGLTLFPGTKGEIKSACDPDGYYYKGYDYDGVPNLDTWKEEGWGQSKTQIDGPNPGNPWGIPNIHALSMKNLGMPYDPNEKPVY